MDGPNVIVKFYDVFIAKNKNNFIIPLWILASATSAWSDSVVVAETRRFFLTSSFLLEKISQICIKLPKNTTTFTSTNEEHYFITSILCFNMNKRQSQCIYNVKQRGNAASGMSVAQSRSTTEIATEKSLTQFHDFQSKSATPSGRFYKSRWFQSHKLQQGILKESICRCLLGILLLTVSSVTHIYGTNIMETLL